MSPSTSARSTGEGSGTSTTGSAGSPTTGSATASDADVLTPRPRPPVAVRALLGSLPVLAIAAAFLGSAFGGWWPALLLIATVVLVAVLTLGALLLRVSMAVVTVGVVVLLIATGYLLVLGAPRVGPDSQVARPAWRILLDAVATVLSSPVGTPPRFDLLAPAVVIVGLATVFLIDRAHLRGPTRSMGIAPLVITPLLYGAGLLLSAGAADRNGVIAGLLVVALILGWARLSLTTAATAAVCGVCATLVALMTPAAGYDIREHVTPPRIVVAQQNLFPYLPMWGVQKDSPVFTVSGVVPDRIAVAVYTGFDGNTWSTGTDFALFGSPRPSVLPRGTVTADYQMQVVTNDIPGDWLPASGTVSAVGAADAVVDLVGGSLVRIGQRAGPLPYTVNGTVDVSDDARLVNGVVPDRESAAPFLTEPDVPESLQRWLNNVVARYPGRYDQAAALETVLRENHTVDTKSSGSSSWYSIDSLVGAGGKTPQRSAPAQNYVSAFAALARSIGLPTRIVIGAKISSSPGVEQVTKIVRGGDMSAWPEIYFSDIGWASFNPVPGPTRTPAQERHEQVKAQQTDDPLADADIPVVGNDRPSSGAGQDGRTDWAGVARNSAIGVLLLVVVLVVLGLVGSVLALLSARRRGAVGAWSSVERAARLADIPVRPDWTTERIAEAISERAGEQPGDRAALVAARADRQQFAPDSGAVRSPWSDVREVRSALRRTLPWYRRFGWFVRPAGWWPRRGR